MVLSDRTGRREIAGNGFLGEKKKQEKLETNITESLQLLTLGEGIGSVTLEGKQIDDGGIHRDS